MMKVRDAHCLSLCVVVDVTLQYNPFELMQEVDAGDEVDPRHHLFIGQDIELFPDMASMVRVVCMF